MTGQWPSSTPFSNFQIWGQSRYTCSSEIQKRYVPSRIKFAYAFSQCIHTINLRFVQKTRLGGEFIANSPRILEQFAYDYSRVSGPLIGAQYVNMGNTYVSKIFTTSSRDMSYRGNLKYRYAIRALALIVIALMWFEYESCGDNLTPRYVNSLTISSSSSPIVKSAFGIRPRPNTITFVLSAFIIRWLRSQYSLKLSIPFWSSSAEIAIIAPSSAKKILFRS